MRLFDFSLKLNGFEINKAKIALEEIQSLQEDGFNNYLKTTRQEILAFHLRNNSFYNAIFNEADVNNWESVPVMTKQHLQQPLEHRLSNAYRANTVYVNKTSGSSGDPFIFAKDNSFHNKFR